MPVATAAGPIEYLLIVKFGCQLSRILAAVLFTVLVGGFVPFCRADNQSGRTLTLSENDLNIRLLPNPIQHAALEEPPTTVRLPVSAAPVHASRDSVVGHGIVGRNMEADASAGGATADLLFHILAGSPANPPPPAIASRAFGVDARQLERWHLSKANLPHRGIEMFAIPDIRKAHSDKILLTIAVFLLQAGAVGALLIQIERRVRVEKSLKVSEARSAATEAQLIRTERQANELGSRLLTLREDERRRIATELHDSTVQHLVAIDLTLHRLRTTTDRPDQLRTCCNQIKRLLDQAQMELRLFAYLRYPPELRDYGLKTVIERFVSGFAERAGIAAQCQVNANVADVPYLLQSSVLRVIQESLANVYRHSRASVVIIRLKLSHDTVSLHVRDNGCGITGHSGQLLDGPCGAGIPAMRARLQEVGGRFRLFSGKCGTLIVGTIPVTLDVMGVDRKFSATRAIPVWDQTGRRSAGIASWRQPAKPMFEY